MSAEENEPRREEQSQVRRMWRVRLAVRDGLTEELTLELRTHGGERVSHEGN